MLTILNVLVIALIALIAYWWSNQGLFSSFLQLVATIAAAAVAISFWEPLATLILTETSSQMAHAFAWGGTLLVLFVVSMVLFRLAFDKLAPNNVNFPQWANIVFGGGLGFATGTITIGMLLIGSGFIQSKNTFMGYSGFQRFRQDGQPQQVDGLWYPAHTYTAAFFDTVSAGAFASATPLRQYAPQLHRQSSLFRDSFDDGAGEVTMPPDAMTVRGFREADGTTPGTKRLFVDVEFGPKAVDFGERLTLTASQIRLIEAPTSRKEEAEVVYPKAWWQDHAGRAGEGKNNYHEFDSISYAITNEPGKERTRAVVEFEVPTSFSLSNARRNAFFMVRNLRYQLPSIEAADASLEARMRPLRELPEFVAGGDISGAIAINNSISPANASVNRKPAGINVTDVADADGQFITSGLGTFPPSQGEIISKRLRIIGIFEPEGERVVRLDISRGGDADVFSLLQQGLLDARDRMFLTDDQGNEYTPMGYFQVAGREVTIDFRPTERMPTLEEVPSPPSSGEMRLELLFRVTQGARITGFKIGNTVVGNANVVVEGRRR